MLDDFAGAPHCEAAYIYACHVVKGHRLACKEERQACQRFLDDLERDDWPYGLSLEHAERACRFIEKLPHTKGKWAALRQRIKLEPWQCFIVVNLFGWVDADGKRRFRDAYLRIPRKNGKSLLAAAIGLYMLCMDDEFGAEVYSGATSEKQAQEVFTPAWHMVKRTQPLQDRFGIEPQGAKKPSGLIILATGSKFEPLIGSPGDGASPSCAIVDEYHEHDTDHMVETMETGMGAREQPLLLRITTAGNNSAGPCYMAEVEYRKLLDGVFSDERMFVLMYGIDHDDDWSTEDALVKANPNIDVSVSREFLEGQRRAAVRNPQKQNAFRRKHLNQWVGAAGAGIDMDAWAKCGDASMRVEDYADWPCMIVLDLASRLDITVSLKLFSRMGVDGKGRPARQYAAFPTFYLPTETVMDPSNDRYQAWVNADLMVATEGEEIDFNEIQADVMAELGRYGVEEVVYDPWRAVQLAQGLASAGATVVEWRGTPGNNTPAIRELEAAIAAGRFRHPNHPVLNWMASNIVFREGAQETLRPMKEKPENKIDGVVAAIMGVGRFVFHDDTPTEIPEGYEVA